MGVIMFTSRSKNEVNMALFFFNYIYSSKRYKISLKQVFIYIDLKKKYKDWLSRQDISHKSNNQYILTDSTINFLLTVI